VPEITELITSEPEDMLDTVRTPEVSIDPVNVQDRDPAGPLAEYCGTQYPEVTSGVINALLLDVLL